MTPPVAITAPPIKTRLLVKAESTDSPLSPPSDEEAGPQRLVADPDSPTSRLLERAARRSLQQAEASSTPERRFNFLNDIARNPKLAAAARMELESASGGMSPITSGGGSGGGGSGGGGSGGGGSGGAASPYATNSPDNGNKYNPTTYNNYTSSSHTSTGGGGGNGPSPLSRLSRQTSNGSSGGVAFFNHTTDVQRQTSLIVQLDADAEQESKINHGMAKVMLTRLQSGKAAAERVLSVLQAFAGAEAAYARAMDALAGLSLPGDADGPTLRAAMSEFSSLPAALGHLHADVARGLTPVIRDVQGMVAELRSACDEIGLGTLSAQKNVDGARKGLKAALAAHREACKSFDAALAERKIGSKSRGVEADPWIAEGRLVERQAGLQAAQTHQRRYLAGAFRRAGELERKRVDVGAGALAALLQLPRTVSLPEVAHAGEELAAALSAVDSEADLESFSAVANNSVRNGDALSARQQELVEHLWTELACSAEVVRQGDVDRYDALSNTWQCGYAVLTRAGFLHWFLTPPGHGHDGHDEGEGGHDDGTADSVTTRKRSVPGAWGPAGAPASSLNLAKCEFEQGEAPAWRLIEVGGGLNGWLGVSRRSLALRTTDVEACMDWAADLREVIAACQR